MTLLHFFLFCLPGFNPACYLTFSCVSCLPQLPAFESYFWLFVACPHGLTCFCFWTQFCQLPGNVISACTLALLHFLSSPSHLLVRPWPRCVCWCVFWSLVLSHVVAFATGLVSCSRLPVFSLIDPFTVCTCNRPDLPLAHWLPCVYSKESETTVLFFASKGSLLYICVQW